MAYGTIATVIWDWGDGTTGSGITATHTYALAGIYTVTATATTTLGDVASTTMTYAVGPEYQSESFAWNFDDGETAEGASVSHVYTAAGWYRPRVTGKDTEGNEYTAQILLPIFNATIVSAVWDFGDGTTGVGVTTDHTYFPGIYDVSVTGADIYGYTAQTIEYDLIHVTGFIITVEPSTGRAPLIVHVSIGL